MPGTPIQIGSGGGGTDWKKVALIGGGIGVVALVVLKKAGGSGAASGGSPTLQPNATIAIGQVESDLLNTKGELTKTVLDQSTAIQTQNAAGDQWLSDQITAASTVASQLAISGHDDIATRIDQTNGNTIAGNQWLADQISAARQEATARGVAAAANSLILQRRPGA